MFTSSSLAALTLLPVALAAPSSPLNPRDGAGSVVTSSNGLAWYSSTLTSGTSGRTDPSSYTCFNGPASNYPSLSTWVNFGTMWNNSVKYTFSQEPDTPAQIQDIYNAIVATSKAAKVDARYILATILLESSGNLSVPCTTSFGGIPNCGLMQSYNGSSFSASTPVKSINAMVQDGTQGTAYGPGLVQLFNDAANTAALSNGNVYAVAREYNSGSVNASDLSDGLGANPSYVSDIANYLQGWNGYGDSAAISSSCSFVASTTPTPTPTPSGPTCASSGYVAAPSPTVAGTTSNCCTWVVPMSGDSCYSIDQEYGITLDQFRAWNTYIDAGCTNLWASTAYCVNGDLAPVPVSSTSAVTSTTSTSATSSAISTKTTSSSKATVTKTTTATTTKSSSTSTKISSTISKATTSTKTLTSSTKTASTASTKTKRAATKTKTKTKTASESATKSA